MTEAVVAGIGWNASRHDQIAQIRLSGDWLGRADPAQSRLAGQVLGAGCTRLAFDSQTLGRWDSGLILFLAALRQDSLQQRVIWDEAGLPPAARRLVAMAGRTARPKPPVADRSAATKVGLATIALAQEAAAASRLIGMLTLRSVAPLHERVSMRRQDLVGCMLDTGLAALPVVTLVNFLFGAVLAFVSAVQLRRLGADIFLANLVGIAVVREMAALMTAIIMTGRSGGAFAATIATMQANEELDALQAIGIPVIDYLILPRVLALTAMMPILYLYGCAVAIGAGALVALITLDLSPTLYFTQMHAALDQAQFNFGMVKSVAFGALIAVSACHSGLRAGRSAADVGRATTLAVVAGVVLVIFADAIFAVCANQMGV